MYTISPEGHIDGTLRVLIRNKPTTKSALSPSGFEVLHGRLNTVKPRSPHELLDLRANRHRPLRRWMGLRSPYHAEAARSNLCTPLNSDEAVCGSIGILSVNRTLSTVRR
jgi:hypothetical protein